MKFVKIGKWIVAGALIASSCFAAEKTRGSVVRASTIRGASVSFEGGGSAGTVQDVVLDPETGCARFVIIQTGGRTVAAPYTILHSSGSGSYTVTVDRERLMSAPVVDVDRIDEFASPEFTQRIYGYYGVSPTEINVRGRRGEREITGGREIRGESGEIQRGTERGTAAGRAGERGTVEGSQSPSRSESAQSPAPVGEARGRQPHSRQHMTPGARVSPSPSELESNSPAPVRERTGTNRGAQRERGSDRLQNEAASPSPTQRESGRSLPQEKSRTRENRGSESELKKLAPSERQPGD